MASLRGPFAELLGATELAQHAQSWVQLTVTDDVRPERMIPRLRERFPYALAFVHDPANRVTDFRVASTRRSEEDARELGADFIAYVTAREALPQEVDVFEFAAETARVRAGA